MKKSNLLISTLALTMGVVAPMALTNAVAPLQVVATEKDHDHDHDHDHEHEHEAGYEGVDNIIVAITADGYVTLHGDHPHSFSGKVPEDAKISKDLVTDKKGEVISEHHAGQVVKVDGEFLFLPNGKEKELIVDIAEAGSGHDYEHEHEHDEEVHKEDVVAKEGDHYMVIHGDHLHEMPVADFTEEQQKEIDQYLKENPGLKEKFEKKIKAYQGEFEDADVKDRELKDWAGEWQSVYPYLTDGTLDPVMEKKAEKKPEKSAEEYKQYYETGYKTDVKEIKIDDTTITFIKEDGTELKGEYKSAGYEILTYESGKRGVRYLFDKVGGDEEAFQSIQFSDHNIEPTPGLTHYHIYFANETQEELLKEMDHWPTYYPKAWSGEEILHDQLNH